MADISRIDVHGLGTSQTKGVLKRGDDKATRGAILKGLSGTNADNQAMIDAMHAEVGDYHHNDPSLPLHSITARRWGKKGYAVARYKRGPSARPTASAREMTKRRAGTNTLEWWRDNTSVDGYGRPSGPVSVGPDDRTGAPLTAATAARDQRMRPWRWRHGVLVFHVPVWLNDSPLAYGLIDLVGKINSNPFGQFSVETFGPKTLRFEGWSEKPIETAAGMIYRVEWVFSWNPHQWVRMKPPMFDEGGGVWETSLEDAHPSATFGVFPEHSTAF